jgi:hypothetical protein
VAKAIEAEMGGSRSAGREEVSLNVGVYQRPTRDLEVGAVVDFHIRLAADPGEKPRARLGVLAVEYLWQG